MIKIPETSPCDLTTSQPERRAPCKRHFPVPLKKTGLLQKPSGSLGLLSRSCPPPFWVACSRCWTSLHHGPGAADWLCCALEVPETSCLLMQEMRVRSLGRGDSPGGGNGNPLQDSCLGNPMDRGAWPAAIHWAAKSQHDLVTKINKQHRSA